MSVHDKLDELEKVLQEALQQIDEIRASKKVESPLSKQVGWVEPSSNWTRSLKRVER